MFVVCTIAGKLITHSRGRKGAAEFLHWGFFSVDQLLDN